MFWQEFVEVLGDDIDNIGNIGNIGGKPNYINLTSCAKINNVHVAQAFDALRLNSTNKQTNKTKQTIKMAETLATS